MSQSNDLFLCIAREAISQMSDRSLTSEIMETGSFICQMEEVYGKDFYDDETGMKKGVLKKLRKGTDDLLKSLLSIDYLRSEIQELEDWKGRLLENDEISETTQSLLNDIDKSIGKLQKRIKLKGGSNE